MPIVLIVDTDSTLIHRIDQELQISNFESVGLTNISGLINEVRNLQPDIMVFDLDMDTETNILELCQEIRQLPHLTHMPILFTTADRSQVVPALDAGGDDLVTKPTDVRVIAARIRALLRRSERMQARIELELDDDTLEVWLDDREVYLTPTEYELLSFLASHQGEYHTAEFLLETVWHQTLDTGDTALVRNHIHNLREKLEKHPDRPRFVISGHGRGYTLSTELDVILPKKNETLA